MFQICACSAGVLRCPSAAMRTVHRVSVGRPFVQSLEDLEQVSGRKVSDIQVVHVPDSREDVHKLQIFDADEVMQTRQIGDEVLSRFEAEDFEHEIIGDVLEPLDTRRRRQFDMLAFEGPFAENRTSRSPGCHDDDDAIVVIDFQQLLGFRPAVDSIRGFVSDRKSLEIKSLEMVDLTAASSNQILPWLRQLDELRANIERSA